MIVHHRITALERIAGDTNANDSRTSDNYNYRMLSQEGNDE